MGQGSSELQALRERVEQLEDDLAALLAHVTAEVEERAAAPKPASAPRRSRSAKSKTA